MELKLKLKLKLNSYHHNDPPERPHRLTTKRKSFNNYFQTKDTNAAIHIVTITTTCIDNVPAIIFRFVILIANQIDNTKGEMK